MKKIFFLLGALITLSLVLNYSCKKDEKPTPAITFTEAQGMADANGGYELTGTIHSDIRLDSLVITKQGINIPYLVDDSEIKNKNDYTYSYLIEGILQDTVLVIEIYDQNGGKTTVTFLVKKHS